MLQLESQEEEDWTGNAVASRQGGVGQRPDLFGKYSGNEVRIENDKYRTTYCPMEEHDEHHASLVSNPEIPLSP